MPEDDGQATASAETVAKTPSVEIQHRHPARSPKISSIEPYRRGSLKLSEPPDARFSMRSASAQWTKPSPS